jgi:transposase InsO family protein
MDRDGKFCQPFRDTLRDQGAKPLLLPPRSPNLNAHIERFMNSLQSEALSRMIFFGEKSLRRAATAFFEHYHAERNHQGLENASILPGDKVGSVAGKIECRERLGGLLKNYHRHAA